MNRRAFITSLLALPTAALAGRTDAPLQPRYPKRVTVAYFDSLSGRISDYTVVFLNANDEAKFMNDTKQLNER